MDNRMKFTQQIALLNQMRKQKLVSDYEYDKIKEYMLRKYKIGVYGMELAVKLAVGNRQ